MAAVSSRSLAAERWLTARTPHFEMLSSASESESRRILTELEQFRANFLASFPFRGASEPRTTIVLFGSEREFRPYRPLYEGKPKEVAGYFLPGPDEVMIGMTNEVGGGEGDAAEVIFHEYVHLLLHVRDVRVPVWLNEGLAELYSTFRVNGKMVEYGEAKDRHVEMLQRSALMPLSRLLSVSHQSPDYNESHRAGMFYAQSWALTHFLVCGADRTYGPKLSRYIETLGRVDASDVRFRDIFGADLQAFEFTLRGYLDGGRYYKRSVPIVPLSFEVKFAPASDLDRDLALANLRWRLHRSADTAFRAHELVRLNPQAPRPHELLAAVAAHEGDDTIALDHWKTAAELKSDNPFVYVQLVRHALSGFHGAAYLDARLPESRIAELRQLTEKALALHPDNPDALELSALIETLAVTFHIPAVNRVQTHALKMRNSSRTLLALAIIRWRAGDHQTASDIIDVILAQRRADMATRSAANLLRSRLPGSGDVSTAGAPVEITPELLASRAAVALHGGRRSTGASELLDRLLTERGSVAPRVVLEPVAVAVGRAAAEDPLWPSIAARRNRAAAGDADAMFDVAAAHALGQGAEFSPGLAFDWLQKARESGHLLAAVAMPNDETDADTACEFLRKQRGETGPLPPLDRELNERIAAAGTSTRKALTVVHQTRPRYPEDKRRAGVAGTAVLRFRVDPRGQPYSISVAEASDPAFAMAAEECARQWRFLPSMRDRVPVATDVELAFRFSTTQ